MGRLKEAKTEMSLRLVEPGLLSLPRVRELLLSGCIGGEAAELKGLRRACRGPTEQGDAEEAAGWGSWCSRVSVGTML